VRRRSLLMHNMRAFTWPLTVEGRAMSFPDLFTELLATISEINSRAQWPLILIIPMPSQVRVDRENGVLTAWCLWVHKSEVRHGRA
jgi:hypothetical protein